MLLARITFGLLLKLKCHSQLFVQGYCAGHKCQKMHRQKLILDCDPGPDDAQALLIALAQPHVDLLAVTCVFGNSTLENSTFNTLRVLKSAGRLDVPVYQGCHSSLIGNSPVGDGFHGKDGFGDNQEEDLPSMNLVKRDHASNALVKLADDNKGEVTLVATGPLTNLAVALKLDPMFGSKLKQCFVMGGNCGKRGNITASAEFNFYSDPEAAAAVLRQLKCPLTVVDLEICDQCCFSWTWYENFVNQPTAFAALIKRIEQYMVDTRLKPIPGGSYDAIWDQLTMVIAIDKAVALESQELWATVECKGEHTRGQMVVEDRTYRWKEKPNVKIITKADKQLFEKYLFQGIGVKI